MDILNIIGRDKPLIADIPDLDDLLREEISKSRFLVIRGAGSIGQVVTRELLNRNLLKLHVFP